MNSPFEYSPLYYYKANDMLNNIKMLTTVIENIKSLLYGYTDNIHMIHNELLNSPRQKMDIIKSINMFKVIQQDFVYNMNSFITNKLSDNKDVISYAYHNLNLDNPNSIEDYWNNIHKIPSRRFTVVFDDETKLTVLSMPSIQINLDIDNRHFSMHYFDNLNNYHFELNSDKLNKVFKYLNSNNLENTEIACFNLILFYESIFNKDNNPRHDLNVLDHKLTLILHELNGVKQLINVRNKLLNI